MSHLCFSFIQPVVGTLAKFPNQHLFWSKPYFSIGNLWATIEILISTQLSFKSTFKTYLVLIYWLLSCAMAFWEILGNFTIGPPLCIKLCLMYGQMGNFQYFSSCLAHWLLKPWHFGKFCHWPCYVHQVMSYVWSNMKFLIFLFLFGMLAVKAMAFWEILLFSHQNLPFLKHVKISLII